MNAPALRPIEGARSVPIRGEEWPRANLEIGNEIRAEAPTFPLRFLGEFWADFVTEAAAGACAPVDYVATPLLATVGAIIGNVRWPEVHQRWSEPPILWAAVVGTPSDGKSPALRQVEELLRSVERTLGRDHDDDLRRYEGEKAFAKAKRTEWEASIKGQAKNGTAQPMPADCVEPVEPVRPRFRVVDITPESAAAVAASQPRGLMLSLDEVATWVSGFGRYAKSSAGGDSERTFWIEAYQGRQDRAVDRKSGSIVVPNLSVGVVGSIQPEKLNVILAGPNDGFASRFLFAWPDKFPRFTIPQDDAFGSDGWRYERALARLLDLTQDVSSGTPRPVKVRLAAEAKGEFEAYTQEKRVAGRNHAGILGPMLGKAPGTALRLAGILEHLWWCAKASAPEPSAISNEALQTALALVDDYYLPMARRVLGEAAVSDGERAAVMLFRHLKAARQTTFNERAVYRQLDLSPEAMRGACEELHAAGITRPAPSRAGSTTGRRANNHDVNPALWAAVGED